jgi:hypothetical protein
MGLGTLSLHAQLPLWRERKSLSVTDSYRGRSGDEEKVNVLSANVGALGGVDTYRIHRTIAARVMTAR